MRLFCPRCSHYFNPAPDPVPLRCPACGLRVFLSLLTGRVLSLLTAALIFLSCADEVRARYRCDMFHHACDLRAGNWTIDYGRPVTHREWFGR